MAKKLVKDMTPAERAERALRARIAKGRRYFGEFAPIENLEYLGEEEGYHQFMVGFENWKMPAFFEVKLYSKSARVYRA